MRFKRKKKHNEIIVKKWFAFFPVEINQEIRWLEFVKVRGYYWLGGYSNNWYWNSLEFVD
jgi:hypothetical protein